MEDALSYIRVSSDEQADIGLDSMPSANASPPIER
jgi:hypothetical protein